MCNQQRHTLPYGVAFSRYSPNRTLRSAASPSPPSASPLPSPDADIQIPAPASVAPSAAPKNPPTYQTAARTRSDLLTCKPRHPQPEINAHAPSDETARQSARRGTAVLRYSRNARNSTARGTDQCIPTSPRGRRRECPARVRSSQSFPTAALAAPAPQAPHANKTASTGMPQSWKWRRTHSAAPYFPRRPSRACSTRSIPKQRSESRHTENRSRDPI